MTVAELGERMSSRELSEWMAYSTLEPFGEERADLRSGIVAATIANVHRDPAKSGPIAPSVFMPQFADDTDETDELPEPSVDELRAKFERITGTG